MTTSSIGAVQTRGTAPTVADDHGFPGCKPVRITREEIVDYEGRIEFWDAETEIAMVCEPTTVYHEQPGQRLAHLTRIIAQSRGAPIETFGTADLLLKDRFGQRLRIMQADQTVYVNPGSDRPRGAAMVVGEGMLPDVVLEVDYSTDVRPRKLGLYQSWGFPEVWVEVPDTRSRSRSSRRSSALTIHLLGRNGYAESAASKAFPGWTAEEIHLAMNEHQLSEQTVAALRRVGRTLGRREGTTPDDDPVLREERRESREEGRIRGREEGRAQGREELRAMLRRLAARRFGAETAARLAEGLVDADSARLDDVADWILECATGRELLARLAPQG